MRTSTQISAELDEQEIQVSLIVRHWSTLFPSGKAPTPMQMMVWLRANGFDLDVVLKGIDALARKIAVSGEGMEYEDGLRYASACMKSIQSTNRKNVALATKTETALEV
jgi:hypothetical protein